MPHTSWQRSRMTSRRFSQECLHFITMHERHIDIWKRCQYYTNTHTHTHTIIDLHTRSAATHRCQQPQCRGPHRRKACSWMLFVCVGVCICVCRLSGSISWSSSIERVRAFGFLSVCVCVCMCVSTGSGMVVMSTVRISGIGEACV